jgi:NAD(P)-dependent dehydrogenase (short-subunit alcohol dehydrogenase family)
MARFTDKTAIVTGAGSGIGLATAKIMIEEGGRVVAVDVSAERLEAAAEELGKAYIPVKADITDPAAPDQILAAAGGPVDILVNNAGIMDGFVPLAEMDDTLFNTVMSVNLYGMVSLSRAVLHGMLEQGHGAIVNTSSEASIRASIAGFAYTVSKHAVNGLTKHISVMYAKDGIRCNAVAPGAVATNVGGEFRSKLAAERLGPMMGATLPRAATADELATTICFLADDKAAANVTGVILPCDGGWSAI